MNTPKSGERDFLAIAYIQGGAGSWYRSSNRDKAISELKRLFKADWKSLVSFKRGHKSTFHLFDVTGHGTVEMDFARGTISDENDKEWNPKPEKVEVTW